MGSVLTLVPPLKIRRQVCSVCGVSGHNKVSCSRRLTETEEQRAARDRVRVRTRDYHRAHKRRENEKLRRRRDRRTHASRVWTVSWKYKVDFDSMWRVQQGKCAICDLPMEEKGRSGNAVTVDHDHGCCRGIRSCGKCVRGLVHRRCNLILAGANDSTSVLGKAIVYLNSWRSTCAQTSA